MNWIRFCCKETGAVGSRIGLKSPRLFDKLEDCDEGIFKGIWLLKLGFGID